MTSKPANAINLSTATAGVVTFDGTATFNTTPITQYDILSGGATASTINQIAPSATVGYALTSAGTSAQSSFTTVQTVVVQGSISGSAPAAGYIGEQILASVVPGSAVSLSNNTAANVTSINLTAGIWDVSAMCCVTGNVSLVGTSLIGSISTTSATLASDNGINIAHNPQIGSNGNDSCVVVPLVRASLSGNTTYYLVCNCIFSAGTANAYGSISATRVG